MGAFEAASADEERSCGMAIGFGGVPSHRDPPIAMICEFNVCRSDVWVFSVLVG